MRLAAITASLLLSLGAGACGGDESEVSDIVPKSVPELTVGEDAGLPAAAGGDGQTDTTSTTDTTTTDTTSTGAAPATPAAPAPATTQQAAPSTGGAPSGPTQTQPPQDGAGTGGFSDFCEQNPGACPGN